MFIQPIKLQKYYSIDVALNGLYWPESVLINQKVIEVCKITDFSVPQLLAYKCSWHPFIHRVFPFHWFTGSHCCWCQSKCGQFYRSQWTDWFLRSRRSISVLIATCEHKAWNIHYKYSYHMPSMPRSLNYPEIYCCNRECKWGKHKLIHLPFFVHQRPDLQTHIWWKVYKPIWLFTAPMSASFQGYWFIFGDREKW